jgi:uncharacterized phosphosugar-binding protein
MIIGVTFVNELDYHKLHANNLKTGMEALLGDAFSTEARIYRFGCRQSVLLASEISISTVHAHTYWER